MFKLGHFIPHGFSIASANNNHKGAISI